MLPKTFYHKDSTLSLLLEASINPTVPQSRGMVTAVISMAQ